MPVLIGRPATPVAVLTGVSVPEIVFTTYAVPSDGEMATAAGEYPTGMPRPARPVAAVMAVTVSESPPTTKTFVLPGVTASELGAWPTGTAGPDGRAGTAGGCTDRRDRVRAV